MTIKVAHISDIHYRGLIRHVEYRKAFKYFFKKCKKLKITHIVITGDIFHTKTQGISPEVIDELSWFFKSCSKLASTHIILGNHDLNLTNPDRQDAISPIINALNDNNLHLYKKSGVYEFHKGYNWAVYSCCDKKGWDNVKPINGMVNIALFHGCVVGSKTDTNWELEGEVKAEFFDGYDIAMLGDIHKNQFLTDDKRIAYPGSAIMQSYGECGEKGFLVWDIKPNGAFDVNFHEIPAIFPFVTVEWQGNLQDTLQLAYNSPDYSRFRIKSCDSIPQKEIKILHNELKKIKKAQEIVFKIDRYVDSKVVLEDNTTIIKNDLFNVKTQIKLIDDFLKGVEFSDKEKQQLHNIVKHYVSIITSNDNVNRNIKWSIKSLKFDNLFSYGKGNNINFNNLNGITGIFGTNRSGKSSIVGTIMYTLFNTTDRGPISNLHIINARKGHCKAEMILNVGGKEYKIERQSVRYEQKSGKQHGVTSLNLHELNVGSPNVYRDLNGLQRNDTDKQIRNLIGTSEDFLMTSLSSQGDMNKFINAGAMQRKNLLSKFLGLEIFDNMFDLVKKDSAEIKAELKNTPDRPWDILISELNEKLINKQNQIIEYDTELSKLRLKLQSLNIELSTYDNDNFISEIDIKSQKELISEQIIIIHNIEEKLDDLRAKNDGVEDELNKIFSVKSKFPLKELRTRYEEQKLLENNVVSIKHTLKRENDELIRQLRSIENLNDIPCGDQYPMCKFIKDSYVDKKSLDNQKILINELENNLKTSEEVLANIEAEKISDKLEKYESLLIKESELNTEISNNVSNIVILEISLERQQSTLLDIESLLKEMEKKISKNKINTNLVILKELIADLNSDINQLDAKRISSATEIGQYEVQLKNLKKERKSYDVLRNKWRIYDNLISAVSKRGIPTHILRQLCPVINDEIQKILHGVVNFTVEVKPDVEKNAMHVFIDYGDSKRIIELASGMEKMIASLAIRVALINISSLPKTDMFIIDEGFGALDESNIEACNRLLDSLKKWFKNIIVITHVDAVKDIVDNMLEITRIGKDSSVIYN